MKSVYVRENLTITEFDTEDIITTSGEPVKPTVLLKHERENRYGTFDFFDQPPSSWF